MGSGSNLGETSTMGKKKRERFARSRSGMPFPMSMNLSRFKFRDSGKTTTGMNQSLDAYDTSEMNDSFDELRIKRTSSAPSREGSTTPPPEAKVVLFSSHSEDIAISSLSLSTPAGSSKPKQSASPHVCVLLEDVAQCDVSKSNYAEQGTSPAPPVKPNGSTPAPTTSTKLQGIVQPLRSSKSSGWL